MKANKLRRAILLTIMALITIGVVFLFVSEGNSGLGVTEAKDYIAQNHYADTAANNAVTAVYLNYRYWDTLFESLILLVSALAVISLSWSSTASLTDTVGNSPGQPDRLESSTKHSPVIKTTAKILIPFIIVFGLYVIINGADSVGGGFQGGAIVAAAFIVRWIILPDEDIDIRYMKAAERIFLMALLLTGMVLLGHSMAMEYLPGRIWMICINLLIGIKVSCGLTIIFYRFVFFESR